MTPEYIWAMAGITIALSVGYWLVVKKSGTGTGRSGSGKAKKFEQNT
ncbi:hypothetical protein JW935_13925 [candidate division KSB1 bacterium]|nr:hypothetical protein [candidate division KSB1 bacterium]